MVQIDSKYQTFVYCPGWFDIGPRIKSMLRLIMLSSRVLVLSMLLISPGGADTGLEIEMNNCHRDGDDIVVCDFSIRSTVSGSNTLTGGQYSQALDNAGIIYDASEVQIGNESGLAVFIEFDADTAYSGKLFFKDVEISTNQFKLVTMRFSDGDWQKSNLVIEN